MFSAFWVFQHLDLPAAYKDVVSSHAPHSFVKPSGLFGNAAAARLKGIKCLPNPFIF
jgi:hypothetical protein